MLNFSKGLKGNAVISAIIGLILISCGTKKESPVFTIGFSQCVESDKWRKTMLEGMKRELSFHENIHFKYRQADNNSLKQIEQVKELMNEKIDLLIISPNEAKPLTPIVEEVYNKGIPVIVVDRKITSNFYTAYVGADNYQIGFMAGEYANNLLKGTGKIIEIHGLPGSSPAIERQKGFSEAIQKYPRLSIIKNISGDWIKSKAVEEFTKIINIAKDADLIYAHNDIMAVGASEALKNAGIDKKIKIIGIDALPGSGGGAEFVADSLITSSLIYPTGGEESIRIAAKILNNESYNKENILQTSVVDSTNVRIMLLQSDKINSQQVAIERQQQILEEKQRIASNQKLFNNILSIALALVIVLGSIVVYSWQKNRKITKKLKVQNDEIFSQRNQLIELSEKAEKAHQAKINFFTNISHEFRTPLTLILAPLEELFDNSRLHPSTKQVLTLIQKNVFRLLRLINQLMDFRKIEFKKMELRATENDLVEFINEIAGSYKIVAKQKQIDLQVFTKERSLNVWFDNTMLDKVVFNLLSNALKFTKPNCFVYVHIEKHDNEAIIKIEDNGVGMSADAIEHAFDPFFQGEYENYKGSGLGLALSKELMELHHGSISVKSEKWKGTSFLLKLPLGCNHLRPEEILTEKTAENVIYEDAKIYTTELREDIFEDESITNWPNKKEKSILIIEDNDELRGYLMSVLEQTYEVSEAQNGKAALMQAFEIVPDLVICDVVLPGKNGLEITRILKTDVRTSHIPVILLTSRNDEMHQIEGLKTHADVYMTKPFNLKILQQAIINLLHNKEQVKVHLSGEILSEEKSQISKKVDRSFINEFSAIVNKNISNDKFSADDICKEIGISRVQLYRKVKALLNCHVNEYIINTRLQKATYYLKHEDFTIGEIAFKTGFSSAAYFSTVFKSKFGVSPRSYKEK